MGLNSGYLLKSFLLYNINENFSQFAISTMVMAILRELFFVIIYKFWMFLNYLMKQDYLSCWTDKNCFKNEKKETICMYEYYRNIVFRNECVCSHAKLKLSYKSKTPLYSNSLRKQFTLLFRLSFFYFFIFQTILNYC